MAKKTEAAVEKIEREYIIPLRDKCKPVPIYRKTEKAIRSVKEFVAKHMKVYDRDLSKIKIDTYLNELLWNRGIQSPPHKIKVKVIKEGEIVRVEAVELPNDLKFKRARETERNKKAESGLKKKKVSENKEEKPVEQKTDEQIKEEAEKKQEADGKKAATIEAGQAMEKAAAKKMKHQVGGKEKEPKHPHRMALQK